MSMIKAAAIVIGLLAVYVYNAMTPDRPERAFVEADFLFDETTTPCKEVIMAGVQRIHRGAEGCEKIDPSSAYLAPRSTPEKPVFFVTCGTGARAFNVYFSKSGIEPPA
jgi:hypothetical protein